MKNRTEKTVLTAQCGNLVIFLPLRFYVKSIFVGVSKYAILTGSTPLDLGFDESLHFVIAEIY